MCNDILTETMRSIIVFVLFITAASAGPVAERIAGGSYTTIENYPYMAEFAYSANSINYIHDCGGSILNNRAVLTAAHCLMMDHLNRARIRLGSSFISSGGETFRLSRIIYHPNWGTGFLDSDMAVVHTDRFITYSNVIQPGSFSGANYVVPENTAVWAAGWGMTESEPSSEQLKHVQLWTLNHDTCKNLYGSIVNDRMICILPRDEGNGQCSGDSGSPLFHNNVIIGVLSFGSTCGSATFPTVSSSVSSYISWIQENA